jgi:hypothetical protein
MSQENIELLVSVSLGDQGDEEEIDELTRRFIDDLNEVEGASVDMVKGNKESPTGAMGDPMTVGTVLLELITNPASIAAFFTFLGVWISRERGRKVILQIGEKKLELTGVSEEEQEKLREWFQTQTGLRIDRS